MSEQRIAAFERGKFMKHSLSYYTSVFFGFALGCGFLVHGVYGQALKNQKCLTLLGNPSTCDTVGATYCNAQNPCGGDCAYCNSTTVLKFTKGCIAWEGVQCQPTGKSVSCGITSMYQGTCAKPAGSQCTCTMPQRIAQCQGAIGVAPCQ